MDRLLVDSVPATEAKAGDTHILAKGEVAIYRDLQTDQHPICDDRVLVRTTFANRDMLIEVEFEDGECCEVSAFDFVVDGVYFGEKPCQSDTWKPSGQHRDPSRTFEWLQMGIVNCFDFNF